MMATLLSKVQLLRDMENLRMQERAAEQRRQESLMQSNSKVGLPTVALALVSCCHRPRLFLLLMSSSSSSSFWHMPHPQTAAKNTFPPYVRSVHCNTANGNRTELFSPSLEILTRT